ncbi:hypothetical protein [Escherichia coli]|uniref:hypothetical protein n=1 Tax=Escherichia coli TaxID=562 RepID=UPI00301CDFA3
MTIRIYPSRLPGEPLETHEHGATTLHRWMKENVRGYRSDMKHPVAVEVDGESIPPQAWFDYALRPDSDVRIYPVPFGLEAATIAWIGVGISVAVAAYSLIMMSNMDKGGYPNKQRGVWVEGSAGVALLARRLGDDATAMDILARLAPLRTRYGYIDSCDYPGNDDMPAWPSSCNTAWMILACDPQGFWNVDSTVLPEAYYKY